MRDRCTSRMRGIHRLGRSQRVVRSRVFDEAFSRGRPWVGKYMVLRLREDDDADRRLGVVASKRTFRRAVDRSRAKRLLREAFRTNRDRMLGTSDVVLVARRRILEATCRDVAKEFVTLAGRAGAMADD